jgi:ribonuclease HI
MAKVKKYYVVWKGINPGVYDNWQDCEKQVKGFDGARYKSFGSLQEAEREFVSPTFNKAPKSINPSFIYPSISVDAACSGNPGDMEYRGVDTKTHQEIFRKGPFAQGTNNIGEFLAIVHALAFLANRNIQCPIYTDSQTAIAWVRNKKAKTKLEMSSENEIIFDLIERAERWLQTNSFRAPIIKWDTAKMGEIPADFGIK